MAFLLLLFTVNSGLMRDDYLHRALLTGSETFPGIQEPAYSLPKTSSQLFSFFTEDNQLVARLKAYGSIPWWTDDELKVSFWRPVAAMTHWLDYQLWPDKPWVMHLHSLLWYVLVGCLLGAWLLQLGVERLALALVMLFYMLDASHVHAITWLANRNILIATALGLLSMMALTRNAQNHRPGYLLVSLLAFFLTLLSAEAGISFFGIVIALLVVLDHRSIARRIGIGMAFLGVIALWRCVYNAMGYGAIHSGFYVDPILDTGNFLKTLFLNGPIMLYEQLVRVPSLSMLMAPQVEFQQATISLLVLLISMAVFSPLLVKNRLATFGFFAAVMALPPACATIVSGGRLMFVFGLGISLVLGLWFAGIKQNADWFRQPKWYRGIAWIWSGILLVAIVLGTGAVWGTKIVSSVSGSKPAFNELTDVVRHVEDDQTLVVLNPPVLFDQMYMPLKAGYFDLPVPDSMISLVPGYTGFTVKLEDERTLLLENEQGFLIANTAEWYQPDAPQSHLVYLASRADRFFVSNHNMPDYQGSHNTRAAQIRVLAVNPQGDPTRIRFRFAKPLFGPDTVVLIWDWEQNRFVQVHELKDKYIQGPF
ncbi:MAG: hypothetical protein R3208_16255 [Ketobacteraceae bacterium]|nr:hypothetical protein [Ketobacteraceae bacterium]